MAGSLLRPPLKLNPLTKKYSSINSSSIKSRSHNKSIIKKYQQKEQQKHLRLLKGKPNSSHQSHQGYSKQLKHLLKHLNYHRQSLLFKELFLLLFSATNDSCWTAIENKNNSNNLTAIAVTAAQVTATTKFTIFNYEQQQKLLQQPQLQFTNKVFASTKKFRKNLLNRKKFQLQLQLQKEELFYRENQLLDKIF